MSKTIEKVVQCPYDSQHSVREDRLQYHLMRCRKNHLDKDFVICPFNTTHHMPRAEFEDKHAKICPDQWTFKQNLTCDDKSDVFQDAAVEINEDQTQIENTKSVVALLARNRQQKKAVVVVNEDEDFFPLGVMTYNKPGVPEIKYSRGRAKFRRK